MSTASGGALTHAPQAKALASPGGSSASDSAPVIANPQQHSLVAAGQRHAHLLGFTVPSGIRDRLTSDPKDVLAHLGGKFGIETCVECDTDVEPVSQLV